GFAKGQRERSVPRKCQGTRDRNRNGSRGPVVLGPLQLAALGLVVFPGDCGAVRGCVVDADGRGCRAAALDDNAHRTRGLGHRVSGSAERHTRRSEFPARADRLSSRGGFGRALGGGGKSERERQRRRHSNKNCSPRDSIHLCTSFGKMSASIEVKRYK